MINYSLTKNTMNPGSKEYIAKVSQLGKTDLDDILDYMVAEGSGLTRPQALAYFEKLMQSFEYLIRERGGFTTPLLRVQTTITGVFRNRSDSFDPARHQINIRITPGTRLNRLQAQLKVNKSLQPEQAPLPKTFIDHASRLRNQRATPGNLATIEGYDLKFDPLHELQGVFFVPENNWNVEIRANSFAGVKSSEVHFLIPALAPGNYTVIVKSIMRKHKSITAGQLLPRLTVI